MNDIKHDNQHPNLERARAAQEKEVEYRSEKRWKIFSWSSSMLIGSIAGAVAVNNIDLGCPERILLCVAVLTLATYTVCWLYFNRHSLDDALDNLKVIDKKLATYKGIDLKKRSKPLWLKFVSYESTVGLLAAIAILMVLIPCLICWF